MNYSNDDIGIKLEIKNNHYHYFLIGSFWDERQDEEL